MSSLQLDVTSLSRGGWCVLWDGECTSEHGRGKPGKVRCLPFLGRQAGGARLSVTPLCHLLHGLCNEGQGEELDLRSQAGWAGMAAVLLTGTAVLCDLGLLHSLGSRSVTWRRL
jgi:hypothetical protein